MKCFKALRRNWIMSGLHVALALIVVGAVLTAFTSTGNTVALSVVFSGFGLYAAFGLLALLKYFRRRASVVVLLIAGGAASALAGGSLPAISAEKADSLAKRQIIYQGRVMPFSNLCSQLTRKLTGKERVGAASDVQFVASMLIYPESWMRTPFIKVKGKELRQKLGLKDVYIAPIQLYDGDGKYRLAAWYSDGDQPLDREILDVDEKLALLDALMRGTLFTPLPEGDARSLPGWKVSVMRAYDRVQPWKWQFMIFLTVGILGLLYPTLFPKRALKGEPDCICVLPAGVSAAMGVLSYCWYWLYIGRPPMVGHSEIMLFMAAVMGVIAYILALTLKKLRVIWAIASLMAGGFAMTGWIGLRDAMVSPLMPALESPWLSVHVSVVMTAYALLALTLPAALGLIFGDSSRRRALERFCLDMLHPGVYLLGIGIITGSIWADTAWGRYWDWDPKETWALITWLLYALPLHFNFIRFPRAVDGQDRVSSGEEMRAESSRRGKILGIYLIIPFLSILMTYIGVNYLDSLHAYG